MAKKKETTKKLYTLTGILEYCQQNFQTKSGGQNFSISDVQGYVSRGKFPQYLGGYKIVKSEDESIVKGNPVYEIMDEKK